MSDKLFKVCLSDPTRTDDPITVDLIEFDQNGMYILPEARDGSTAAYLHLLDGAIYYYADGITDGEEHECVVDSLPEIPDGTPFLAYWTRDEDKARFFAHALRCGWHAIKAERNPGSDTPDPNAPAL